MYAAKPLEVFRHVEGEDGIVMVAHLPNGAVGLVSYSNGTSTSKPRHWLNVTGSIGQLSFIRNGNEVPVETSQVRRTVRVPEARRGVCGMVKEFRDSIMEGREPTMSGQEGLKDLAIVLAAYRSAEHGQEVSLTPSELGG